VSDAPTVETDGEFVDLTIGNEHVKLTPREARDLAEALNEQADVVDSQP
jgi:hypothetical protein